MYNYFSRSVYLDAMVFYFMPQILAEEKNDKEFNDLAFKIYVRQLADLFLAGRINTEDFVDRIIELKKRLIKES